MAQLQIFEENINDFNPNNPFSGDDKLPVEFYIGTIPNDGKTLEAGRPIYDEVESIRIYNSKDNIVDRPVRDIDKRRWPRQYSAWKAGNQEAGMSGTRLEHWAGVTRAQAEELKYFKIFTLEQLADFPDSLGAGILGIQQLKTRAKMAIEVAKNEAPYLQMQKELSDRDAEIVGLKDQLSKLASRLEAVENRKGK